MRYGVRLMRRTPGFAAAAILTVALGIGATTAMFSVVYGVVLQPLPYREPDRLVNLWNTAIKRGLPRANVGMANVYDWKARNHVFEDIAALRAVANFNLTGQGEPERLNGSRVSANLFPVLGVTPLLGRTFTEDEDEIGHEHVAILTYGLWVRRFGADPAVVGRTISLNGEPHTVVGVMRPDFAYPDPRVPDLHAADVRSAGARQPDELLVSRGRAPEAGRVAGAGAGRDGRAVGADRARASAGERRHRRRGGADAGRHGRGGPDAALRPAGRGGGDAADRLREPGEPAGGARARPPARARGARGARRRARAADPAVDRRARADAGGRRRARPARRRVGDRRARAAAAGRRAARRERRPAPAGARVHGRHARGDRRVRRRLAGARGVARRAPRLRRGSLTGQYWCAGAVARPRRTGGRADRRDALARRRRRAAAAQLRRAAAGEPGLQPRARLQPASRDPAQQVSDGPRRRRVRRSHPRTRADAA